MSLVVRLIKDVAESECKTPLRGRPREFCVEEALASALRVFCSKGYEGTSLNDLTDAMGVARPSLYAAFGNKEALFRKVLDLYQREKLKYVEQALAQPSARLVAQKLFQGAVDSCCNPDEPRGCLGVITAASCGDEAQAIRQEVLNRGSLIRDALIRRLDRANAEGDLPAHVDPRGAADLLIALLQGLSIQARGGASRHQLERLTATGMALWP